MIVECLTFFKKHSSNYEILFFRLCPLIAKMELLKSENDEFHEACLRGDLDKVTHLLSRKEEIVVKLLDKKFALESAVWHGYPQIVELLLRIGVNVNQRGRLIGFRPLHLACAKQGNLTIAKILLDNGADINATVKIFKETALHYAVLHQKTSITKLLLKNGCKTNVRNHDGLTTLEIALDKGFVGIVKLMAFHNK